MDDISVKLFLFQLLPCLPLAAGIALLFTWRERRGFAPSIARGCGLASLWALPAVPLQFVLLAGGFTAYSFDSGDFASMLPTSWWVLLGGRSVQAVFEETAQTISGHRQMTMLDNWPYYYGLTLAQTLCVAILAAWRLQRGKRWSDPLLLALGALVLANAVAGVTWPWWGS